VSQQSGWLSGITHAASPFFNDRPTDGDISLLVIHNISLPAGCYGGPYIEQLFCGTLDCCAHPSFADLKGLEVSAHFLIRRDGRCCQFVATDKRAWHAGISCFEGREACNDFSIGIELEGCDHEDFSPAQYHMLSELTLRLIQQYPAITWDRIVGHCDIAPGRKTDPGPFFNWAHYKQLVMQSAALAADKSQGVML
jgi:AmpD protein